MIDWDAFEKRADAGTAGIVVLSEEAFRRIATEGRRGQAAIREQARRAAA